MFYCEKCLNVSTRPRIQFVDGVCNACRWHEEKKTIDWEERKKLLERLCKSHKKVLVPCSGGKDGSYVAWKLKHEYGMEVLAFTLEPQSQTEIGRINLENFKDCGFNHILVSPDRNEYRRLAKVGFVEYGQPKMPFVNGITTAALRLSREFKIPLIMLGEEGEMEYGGTEEFKDDLYVKRSSFISPNDYLIKCYYSGVNPNDLSDNYWFTLENPTNGYSWMTHWSKFENWDPEEHARFCSKNTGLQMSVGGQIGTFTNYAQLDDALQDLHAFMMFVKYGFGRATSDCCIEIRRGRMTRDEGVEIVKKIDGEFPLEYLEEYLKYFEMNEKEFWAVVDKHANNVLIKTGDKTRPYILK